MSIQSVKLNSVSEIFNQSICLPDIRFGRQVILYIEQ